ncbi:unnamed protein product [Linum trigynum]|uniref:Retrotransposon gag domain-containing protein n=1 Tax=Linum trigynum TaxID=586398 RepID=A0AAV2EZ06_9ROSI
MITRTRIVAEYRAEFLKLGNMCKGVLEEYLVGLCMAGLRPEIVTAFSVFESNSLRTAFRLAGRKEEEITSRRNSIGRYKKLSGGRSSSVTTSNGGGFVAGSNASATLIAATRLGLQAPPNGFVKLLPAEIE